MSHTKKNHQGVKILRRDFNRTALAAAMGLVAVPSLAEAAMPLMNRWEKGPTGGSLEAGLACLNRHAEQPESIQEIYRVAYGILSKKEEATFMDLSSDAGFQRLCRDNGMTHLGGPMLGNIGPDGADVWIRTLKPASVEVRVSVKGKERACPPVKSTAASDLVALVKVKGLMPGTVHPYRVIIDGKPASIPGHAAITTVAEEKAKKNLRLIFGSCFHRWGLGNPEQAGLILRRKPAALLFMGDIAVQDRRNHLGLHRADYFLRELHPPWRDMVSALPTYASWDDHDYFANDQAGIPRGFEEKDRQGVCDVFRQNWNQPSRGFGHERCGVFFRTRIGPCDVIMTDNRFFREGRKGFLGDMQMEWLEKQLLDCRGPFIVLSCGTMWSDYVSNGKDSWGKKHPEGRERIFNLIEKNRIGGVLLISGDRHGARGFRIPRPSGFELYEFGAASLGGRSGPPVKRPEWNTQLYGISGKYAFGEFTFDLQPSDPEVTFRLIQDGGKTLYEMTLPRSRLTPKAVRGG